MTYSIGAPIIGTSLLLSMFTENATLYFSSAQAKIARPHGDIFKYGPGSYLLIPDFAKGMLITFLNFLSLERSNIERSPESAVTTRKSWVDSGMLSVPTLKTCEYAGTVIGGFSRSM